MAPPTSATAFSTRGASKKRVIATRVPAKRHSSAKPVSTKTMKAKLAKVVEAPIARPTDWPGDGPIDLAVHDLPHASSALEWWYVNSHFETESGRKLAVFAAFFRELSGKDEATGTPQYAHSITWALSDQDNRRYYPRCAVDKAAPGLGLKKLDAGAGAADDRLNR